MRKTKSQNIGKWLALCFPYGLYLMWRRSCGWHKAVKGLVTAGFLAAAVAIVAMPTPERLFMTVVDRVETEKKAEIFGPELPAGYDVSMYVVAEGGHDLLAEVEEDNSVYVYASATEGSTYYHDSQCKYAFASSPRLTLYEAYKLGYITPCGICNPPVYDPATGS